MPTYQYACKDCFNHFEQVQAFSDPSLTICPNCQGSLRKVYGSVGVVFKGSGFYRTDSRSGSNKASLSPAHKSDPAAGSDSSASGSPADSGSAKSDAGGSRAAASSSRNGSSASTASPSSAPAKAAS